MKGVFWGSPPPPPRKQPATPGGGFGGLCSDDAADWGASGAAPWWPLQIYDVLACDYMMLLSCKITVQLLMLLPTWSMLCMALTTPCKRVKLLLAVALRRVALSDPCARMMLWT